jgi:hypothetical protein
MAEERAAILEYMAGMSRKDAEETTAKARGFNSWREMMEAYNAP